MSISVRNYSGHASSGGSTTLAITLPATAGGNKIIVEVWWSKGGADVAISSVTDNKGNTYSRDDSATIQTTSAGTHQGVAVYSAPDGAGGGVTTVTVTFAAAVDAAEGNAEEVVGLAASALDARSAHTDASGTSASTGAVTTGQAAEYLVIVTTDDDAGSGQSFTVPGGFTARGTQGNGSTGQCGQYADQIVNAIQSGLNPQWTLGTAASSNSAIVTYKGAAGAAGPFPCKVILPPLNPASLE